MNPRQSIILFLTAIAALAGSSTGDSALGQTFYYESKPRVQAGGMSFASTDPAPTMMEPAEEIGHPLPRRRYLDPRLRGRAAELTDVEARRWASRAPESRVRARTSQLETIPPGTSSGPIVGTPPGSAAMMAPSGEGGNWADPSWQEGPPSDAPWVDGMGLAGSNDEYEQYEQYGEEGPCEEDCAYDEFADTHLFAYLDRWWHAPNTASNVRRNFSTFTTAQGFKGPTDRGVNGNFGFGKGVNWGTPFWDRAGIGLQAGATVAFSDFSGAAGLVDHARTQFFVTGGLFRRAPCNHGWQGGAVLDYLHDDFYVRMNLLQIRAEISYLWGFHEIGIWAATRTKNDTQPAPPSFGVPTVTWRAANQFNLFYRANFSYLGVGRMWVGATEFGDVTFGGDATAPLSERWAIQLAQNYLLPREGVFGTTAVTETWGLTMALVWYPHCKTRNDCFDAYRPLFPVADNSWLFIGEKD